MVVLLNDHRKTKDIAMTTTANQTFDDATTTRTMVAERYGAIAKTSGSCCGPTKVVPAAYAENLGYDSSDIADAPDEANLALGCGNPVAIAKLNPGDTVVDLGSGGGFDAIVAARKVGPTGRVIGVDMTQDMLGLARRNAVKAGVEGFVEFREGIISKLPVVDDTVDVIISNCVINLSPDKKAVLQDAFRVLKPGGRFAVSDILVTAALPAPIKSMAEAYFGCVAGASLADEFFATMEAVGFERVTWTRRPAADALHSGPDDTLNNAAVKLLGAEKAKEVAESVWSYTIEAYKPSEA